MTQNHSGTHETFADKAVPAAECVAIHVASESPRRHLIVRILLLLLSAIRSTGSPGSTTALKDSTGAIVYSGTQTVENGTDTR